MKNTFDKKLIHNYYNNLVDKHGPDTKSLGWSGTKSQHKRFEILCGVGELSGKQVLDVGCGMADLYDYLIMQGVNADYTGVDITPRMIELAKSKHPELNLELLDILEIADVSAQYDYVVASGIFNLKIDRHEEFVYSVIQRMFDLCKTAIAFNIQSSCSDTYDDGEFYANPSELLDYCLNISRRVVFRHDYMPHDLTIYIYRENKNSSG
ncbi:MAG: class I SAM-dependent methyltransferase [Planctomycetes bacterium]|nr:class I SAM-dependent methyltransferase [Planctomycetota bacterium]